MFRSVLLTTDGSGLSRAALPHALRLVDRRAGTLRVLRVSEPPPAAPGQAVSLADAPPTALSREAAEALHAAARADVDAIRHATIGAAPPQIDTIVLDGAPGPTIVSDARASGAEVVVMATHGRSGLARTVLGSVANYVLRELRDVPLVLVRPTRDDEERYGRVDWITVCADQVRAAREPFQHVLVPIDGSELATAVLPHVIRAADAPTAVDLLMVIASLPADVEQMPALARPGGRPAEDPDSFADREARAWIERGRARLDEAREQLEANGIHRVNALLRGGNAEQVIVDLVSRRSVDLVAMATHGRSGLRRTLLGSVPDHVLRHVPGIPVLLTRPSGAVSTTP